MFQRLFAVVLVGMALFGPAFIAANETSSTASVTFAPLSK
jgi:hypothetical protein